jgi:hypothetical protein
MRRSMRQLWLHRGRSGARTAMLYAIFTFYLDGLMAASQYMQVIA